MNMTSERDTSQRWWMLLILSLGLLSVTLNWFDVSAAFPQLGRQFHLQIPQLTNLISLFLLGYAIFHIPAGMLAYRIGVKNTLLLGLLLEALSGIATAFVPNYGWLEILRFFSGAGAAFCLGASLALITSWFRRRELALAMGISTAVGLTLGQVLALFVWIGIIQTTGWQIAIILGGVIELIIFVLSLLFLRIPGDEAERLAARKFSWTAMGRVLGNRNLWLVGLSFFGVYGAGLTTVQLLTIYVGVVYHVPAAIGGLMVVVYILMDFPGSIIGGFWADHTKNVRAVFIVPWIVFGLTLSLFSFLGLTGVWIMVVLAGGVKLAGSSAWTAMPGHYRDRVYPEDVTTAVGLLFTLAGLGGFAIPVLFGLIEESGGFTPAFVFAGIVSTVFAVIGFAAREPRTMTATPDSVPTVTAQSADASL